MSGGRARRIDLDSIISATLRLGLDTATTVSVANSLGVEQPALYRHVSSKTQMLDLAAARSLDHLTSWAPEASWATSARMFQDALWGCLSRQRGLAEHLLSTTTIPSPLQNAAERLVVSASASGIPLRSVVLTVDALVHLTCHADVGSRRMRQQSDLAAWRDRTVDIDDVRVRDVVRQLEDAEPLSLAREQLDILLAGLGR